MARKDTSPSVFGAEEVYDLLMSLPTDLADLGGMSFSHLATDLVQLVEATSEEPNSEKGMSVYMYRKDDGESLRTLVIEDSHSDAFTIEKHLDGTRFHVIGVAEDGLVGVKKYLQLCDEGMRPHIVLLNLIMPKLNGVEATKLIMRISTETRVIGMSNVSNTRQIEEMFRAGALAYIIKPLKRRELINTMNEVMMMPVIHHDPRD